MKNVLASDSDTDRDDDYFFNDRSNDDILGSQLSVGAMSDCAEAVLFLQKKALSLQQKKGLMLTYSSFGGPCEFIGTPNFSFLHQYPETSAHISPSIQGVLTNLYKNQSYAREFRRKAARKTIFTDPAKDTFFGFKSKCPSTETRRILRSNVIGNSTSDRKMSAAENCALQALRNYNDKLINTDISIYQNQTLTFSPLSAYEEAANVEEKSPYNAAAGLLHLQQNCTPSVCKKLFEIEGSEEQLSSPSNAIRTVIDKHIEKNELKLLWWKKTIFPQLF